MPATDQKELSNARMERGLLNLAFVVLTGYESLFTAFLRSHMGSLYLLKGFVGGAVVLWFWFERYQIEALIPFGGLWMVALLIQKIRSGADEARGHAEHRQYGGDPAVVRAIPLLGRCNDTIAKCVIEPGMVFIASYGMDLISPALGQFFAWGSFVMMAHANLGRALLQEQRASIRDARISGRNMAEYQRRWH